MTRLWATLEPPKITLPEVFGSRQDVFWEAVRSVESVGNRMFGDLLGLGHFNAVIDGCSNLKFGPCELPALATGLKYFNM